VKTKRSDFVNIGAVIANVDAYLKDFWRAPRPGAFTTGAAGLAASAHAAISGSGNPADARLARSAVSAALLRPGNAALNRVARTNTGQLISHQCSRAIAGFCPRPI
jgi:hypothetical protein